MASGGAKAAMMLAIIASIAVTLVAVLVVTNFHTPEKRIQHQVRHLYPVADPQFEREMGTLLGPAILAGNKIIPLQNGDEIFPAMLNAIGAAKDTINFETYIYWSGKTGDEFANALIERAQAGVKVHLMLDWLGSEKMTPRLLTEMKDAGVEIERYHALHWFSLGKLNNRTHRKVLIVDGRIGFTGGVGIADQWTGHAQDPDHWRDMHFQIEGPVVAQFQAAFLDNWITTTGRVLNGDTYFPQLTPIGEMKMQMFMSSPAGGSESMRLMYLMAITAAEQSIDIEAAYFIPDELMSRELIKARSRGVRIRILLPDKHIDSETVRIATKRAWGPLLKSGVEIHEYDPTMLHCKMLIFDHYMVSVGSTNFDMRSFELNDEASLNVYDPEFANRLTDVFEADLKLSTPYDYQKWLQRSWMEKMAEVVLIPIRSQL
jgi:cardiolipin synthase A/B